MKKELKKFNRRQSYLERNIIELLTRFSETIDNAGNSVIIDFFA